MKTIFFLTLGMTLSLNLIFSQVNFNNYKPLRSKGEMPDDFRLAAQAKVSNNEIDLGNLDKKKQTEFLENIHYGLDQLLNSGIVVYGDEVSKYIEKIADNLLKNDKETRKKLRFYVLKSDAVNAFATNQGMLFFTTGLLAQFSSEAQLAFVLAHEITHFKENHVLQSYETTLDKKNTVEQLSKYSKEHELEADRAAVKLCHDAGYAKEEIYGSFDVLMFSHLPFDEIPFDKTYFNTDYFYVPESIYSKKVYKINMDEDYNDELSSHPNIEKRRSEVENSINKFNNWQQNSFRFDKQEFYEIRNICRFETIRQRIITGEIPYALYEIYILEQEFPNSESLKAFKAHAWYDLARLRIDGNWRNIVPSEKELEGESGTFLEFISKHKPEQTYAFALRTIYDIKRKYPDNEYIDNIYNKTIALISSNKRFQKSKYYDISYKKAEELYLAKKNEPRTNTVETVVEETPKETGSKYSRIRKSSSKPTEKGDVNSIDTLNYHYYGFVDILADESFLTKLTEKTKGSEDEDEDTSSTSTTSKQKKKRINSKTESIQINGSIASGEKLIITTPIILTNTTSNNAKRNANITPDVIDAIDYALTTTKTNYVKVGGKSGANEYSTKTYNQNSFVNELLLQISDLENNSLPIVPIDFDQAQLIMSQLGSKKIAYFFYGENKEYRISYGKIFGFVWFPPSFLMNILAETTARQNALAAIYTFDLESGLYQTSSALRITMKPSKMVLRSSMYNLINRP